MDPTEEIHLDKNTFLWSGINAKMHLNIFFPFFFFLFHFKQQQELGMKEKSSK